MSRFHAIASFLFLFFLASPCLAEDRLLVLTEEFPPYNYSENGLIVGSSTEIVKAILSDAALDYTMDILPWKRAMHTTETRPNTLLFSMSRTPERESRFLWLAKIVDNSFHVYALKERNDLLNMEPEQLISTASICIQDGTSAASMLRKAGFPEAHMVPITDQSNSQCLKMAARGNVDLIVRNTRQFDFADGKDSLQDLFTRYEHFTMTEELYLSGNLATDTEIVERIQRAFSLIKSRKTTAGSPQENATSEETP